MYLFYISSRASINLLHLYFNITFFRNTDSSPSSVCGLTWAYSEEMHFPVQLGDEKLDILPGRSQGVFSWAEADELE